jgi:hypothetical protein
VGVKSDGTVAAAGAKIELAKWNLIEAVLYYELIRQELKVLRDRNLSESTFEERVDLVGKLGIKILTSEDSKSRKIFCRLNLAKVNDEKEQACSVNVTFGGPLWTRTTGPGLIRTEVSLLILQPKYLINPPTNLSIPCENLLYHLTLQPQNPPILGNKSSSYPRFLLILGISQEITYLMSMILYILLYIL